MNKILSLAVMSMKQYLLLFFTLTLTGRLSAQQRIFEEPVGWRGRTIELHTISDRDKQQNCLFLFNSDSIRIYLLDNRSKTIHHYFLQRAFAEKLLGGYIKDGKIYAYLHVGNGEPHIHGWTIDIASGKGEDYYIPFEMKHERLVDRISCGDHFLYFTVNKKTSEFILYDFRDGKNYDTWRYRFEDGIWKALTVSAGLSRDINVAKLDQEGEPSVEIAEKPNKIYLVRDTLYLLMNKDERGVTDIFSFDLLNRQVGVRKILHNDVSGFDPPLAEYTDNSILLDGKLYFVSATSDSLCVQVRDFGNGELLRQYTAGRDEEIPFKNTPIIQEGNVFAGNTSRELGKTRQLVRKMLNGSAVISAGRDDSGRIALSVGSYTKMSSGGGGGGGMWMGGPGGAAAPMVFVPSGGFYRSTWTKSARFGMLLDSSTLQHVSGEMPLSINEKIENYTTGITIPSEGENLFMNDGNYIYAYYNRDERKLLLIRF